MDIHSSFKTGQRGKALIKGTLLLSAVTVIVRIMGFFIKIWISRILSNTDLGKYQLILSFFIMAQTLYSGAAATTMTAFTSKAPDFASKKRVLIYGIRLSLMLSCAVSFLVFVFSDLISIKLLREQGLGGNLRLLSLCFPFCGFSTVICGYCFGLGKTSAAALSMFNEQIARIIATSIAFRFFSTGFAPLTLVISGIIAGELGGFGVALAYCIFNLGRKEDLQQIVPANDDTALGISRDFLSYFIPLHTGRIILSLLSTADMLLLPLLLTRYGLSRAAALSFLGITESIAMPFILFPAALINSYLTLLISRLSQDEAGKDYNSIRRICGISIRATAAFGIFFAVFFFSAGEFLGNLILDNRAAGIMIKLFSINCIFIYMSMTLTAILNGLMKTKLTFKINMLSLIIRLSICIIFIPFYGIRAYILALPVSQAVLSVISYKALKDIIQQPVTIHTEYSGRHNSSAS